MYKIWIDILSLSARVSIFLVGSGRVWIFSIKSGLNILCQLGCGLKCFVFRVDFRQRFACRIVVPCNSVLASLTALLLSLFWIIRIILNFKQFPPTYSCNSQWIKKYLDNFKLTWGYSLLLNLPKYHRRVDEFEKTKLM